MRDESGSFRKRQMASILPEVLRDRGWERQVALHSIFLDWSKVVDETVSAHTRPLKIVNGTLWVETENSAWLQQLRFQKVALLEAINSFLKGVKIDDIRLVLSQGDEPPQQEEPKVCFHPLSPEAVERFAEQAACIEDQQTREALIRLWYLSKACVRKEQG